MIDSLSSKDLFFIILFGSLISMAIVLLPDYLEEKLAVRTGHTEIFNHKYKCTSFDNKVCARLELEKQND